MRTPAAYVRGVRHPEAFHGRGVTRGYFEGWYNKVVSADRTQRWAVIPGVFRGLGGTCGEPYAACGSIQRCRCEGTLPWLAYVTRPPLRIVRRQQSVRLPYLYRIDDTDRYVATTA